MQVRGVSRKYSRTDSVGYSSLCSVVFQVHKDAQRIYLETAVVVREQKGCPFLVAVSVNTSEP